MRRTRSLALLFVAFAMLVTACGDTTPETVIRTEVSVVTETVEVPGETVTETVQGQTITFWSTETQEFRIGITKDIIDRFTAETGIEVKLVPVSEDNLTEIMLASAATGILPEVIFHPLDFTVGWANQGLLDTDAAAAVVSSLDPNTFSQGALDMVTVDGNPAAVPSDGWGQLLIYRSDLFDAAGLDAPDTFAKIEAAAAALNDPANDLWGITAATEAGQVFTQQTFEHFALANGCQMVDDAGNVTLDTPECVEAIEFFTDLMENYSPGGSQDVVTTRATYFAGQAAMIIWSPFILDEMAGLRDSAFPACDECADDAAYLAKNSAIVPSFSGPSGEPAQYGQISYMGIGTGSNTEAAQQFLEFWFNDGYLDWLSTGVEGKLPMRQGTPDDPTAFIEGWKALETGVDRKSVLSDFYGDEIINTLIQGTTAFNRWGFPQNQGELVSAVYTTLPVPAAIRAVLDGSLTAAEAAAEIQAAVEEELSLIGG